MQLHITILRAAILLFLLNQEIQAALVQVGAGAYTTALPAGQKSASDKNKNPIVPKVTSDFAQPPQTNDWWSSLIWQHDPANPFSNNLFAHPLSFRAAADGLQVGYPAKYNISPDNLHDKGHHTQEYHYGHLKDIIVNVVGMTSADTRVSGYSDWCVTAVFAAAGKKLEATIGHGLPFVYFTKSGGDITLKLSATPTIWYNKDGVIGLTINSRHYGIFFPHGSTVTGTTTMQSALNGKDYFSLAVLPDNTPATLEFYRKHAYAFVTDSSVAWSYNESTAQVVTEFAVQTVLKENLNGNLNRPLIALYRHQWLHTTDALTAYSYVSPRGEMKVLDGSTFTTQLTFHGVLPTLPNAAVEGLDGFNKTQLYNYVDEFFKLPASSRWKNSDTYWSGKEMGKAAIVLQLADQVGHTAARDLLLTELKNKLQEWLDGKEPRLYYYDNTWKALIGYPASFGSDVEFNDHHFHWGYAVIAAGIVAIYDPVWASNAQWGGMVQMLIKDAANADRSDNRFPFLRNYDVYAGHGWANGAALFGSGNNQESSSESINFSTGCILFGSATGNKAIRDLGIFLYATEVSAIQQYWFDVDNAVFPPDFKKECLGVLWSNGGAYAIWWSGYVEELHGINFIPLTGGSLHLGLVPDYLKLNQEFMLSNGGGNDSWKDIQMETKAFYDPKSAIATFNAGYTPESGESKAHTYHWIHTLNALGRVDEAVTANIPTYAVFNKANQKTYVAYNPSNGAVDVTYSDGFKMSVPARTLKTSKDTSTPPPTPQYVATITNDGYQAVVVQFKPEWIPASVTLKYAVDGIGANPSVMQNNNNVWQYRITGLKNNAAITYSFDFDFNGQAVLTEPSNYTFVENVPNPTYNVQANQLSNGAVRIVVNANNASNVQLQYRINTNAAVTLAMPTVNASQWASDISGLSNNDVITYSVSFDYFGSRVISTQQQFTYQETPAPTPTYDLSLSQDNAGSVTITFKPATFTIATATLTYAINNGQQQITSMNNVAGMFISTVSGLKNGDAITYGVSFIYNNATQSTPLKNYTYVGSTPTQDFDHGIEGIKRITFRPNWPAHFVYVTYAVNDGEPITYGMNKECDLWYYILENGNIGDRVTYSFGYEYYGVVIQSDEYQLTI